MEKRNHRGLVVAVVAGMLVVAAATVPDAYSGAVEAPRLTILGARVDRLAGTLTIQGRNLVGGTVGPEVFLGGAPLVVSSAAPETIVAELPPGVAPGSLLLTVTLAEGGRSQGFDSFAASIPADEIVTPDGITIQSTGSDVRILAGTSRITVDPAGGITIESDGPVNVRTPGALDLRGRTVNVAAETTLTLSGATVDVNATSLADISGSRVNLHAGSVADIRGTSRVTVVGGLVTLN